MSPSATMWLTVFFFFLYNNGALSAISDFGYCKHYYYCSAKTVEYWARGAKIATTSAWWWKNLWHENGPGHCVSDRNCHHSHSSLYPMSHHSFSSKWGHWHTVGLRPYILFRSAQVQHYVHNTYTKYLVHSKILIFQCCWVEACSIWKCGCL